MIIIIEINFLTSKDHVEGPSTNKILVYVKEIRCNLRFNLKIVYGKKILMKEISTQMLDRNSKH